MSLWYSHHKSLHASAFRTWTAAFDNLARGDNDEKHDCDTQSERDRERERERHSVDASAPGLAGLRRGLDHRRASMQDATID